MKYKSYFQLLNFLFSLFKIEKLYIIEQHFLKYKLELISFLL